MTHVSNSSRKGRTYQRAKGRGKPWSFVVDIGPEGGPRKQMRRHGFGNQKSAQAALNDVLGSLQHGDFVQPSELTVGGYFEEWISRLLLKRKPSTADSYERYLRNHLLNRPAIERMKLQALTSRQLDAIYADMLLNGDGRAGKGTGLKPRSVRYFHTIVHAALKDAQKGDIVSRNVADAVTTLPEAKAAKAPEFEVWTHEELARFLDFISSTDDPDEPHYTTSAGTGARRAEMCGLRWQDVFTDGDEPLIQIRQTLQVIKGKNREKRIVIGTPKSHESRPVDIDETVVAALKRQRRRQAAWKLAMGAGWPTTIEAVDENDRPITVANDLVFTNPDGTPMAPVSVGTKFQRRARWAGVTVIRLHDLRHTHATHLLEAGVNPNVVAARLGHANAAFTLARYGHVLPRSQAAAAKAVGETIAAFRKVQPSRRRPR